MRWTVRDPTESPHLRVVQRGAQRRDGRSVALEGHGAEVVQHGGQLGGHGRRLTAVERDLLDGDPQEIARGMRLRPDGA